jgi:hypothetical protein
LPKNHLGELPGFNKACIATVLVDNFDLTKSSKEIEVLYSLKNATSLPKKSSTGF